MVNIKQKKIPYKVTPALRQYLKTYNREIKLPIQYSDLDRFEYQITLYDKYGNDTLWVSLQYSQDDLDHINDSLKRIYALLKTGGDDGVMRHLYIDRVDLCLYGNTNPYRIRIVNNINDNFDYFYVKRADASRIYGLELEHLLSPNSISYLVNKNTLIEAHIAGIPGKEFIENYLNKGKIENETRLAKEFVKFNERCFVRLLGDMHSSNFVIEIMQDFDDVHYRIRAIDFDQQSYEPRRSVYLPQYYKQNQAIIDIGLKLMTPTTVKQYQKEERTMIANRIRYTRDQLKDLIDSMVASRISKKDYVEKLGKELAHYYHDKRFLSAKSMGEMVDLSLTILVEHN